MKENPDHQKPSQRQKLVVQLVDPVIRYPQALQPVFTNQFPPTQANIPSAMQGRPDMEYIQPRLDHSQSHPPQDVYCPPLQGNMPPNKGGNGMPPRPI